MAKAKPKAKPAKKPTKKTRPKFKRPNLVLNSQQKLVVGSFLIILGVLLFIAFLSFFFTGEADQSTLSEFSSRQVKSEN